MLDSILARLRQGHKTIAFPRQPAALPDRFRGRPIIDEAKCSSCGACVGTCPMGAIFVDSKNRHQIDLGKCLFCPDCSEACPNGAIHHSGNYRLAARRLEDLIVSGNSEQALAKSLDEKMRAVLGRSLRLRQVSAGGCNACEADTNVLGTITYDLGRFGIQFVASPRHADGLLVTGPVPENMRLALLKTYEAIPSPKIVIAVGACALSGGPFAGNPEVHNGASNLLPIDLYIPGCPPHPITILDGLLRLIGYIGESNEGDKP